MVAFIQIAGASFSAAGPTASTRSCTIRNNQTALLFHELINSPKRLRTVFILMNKTGHLLSRNSPKMYLLRTTLHCTGSSMKSWLMVATVGSMTNGMRKRNKEKVAMAKEAAVNVV